MLGFKQFINEEYLFESKSSQWGLNTTDSGKMHEILVGGLVNHYGSEYQKHRSKGASHEEAHDKAMSSISNPTRTENEKGVKVAKLRHMAQFKEEKANKSAEQWHDHLSSKLSQEHYDEHLSHAHHAAKNIIEHMHSQGMKEIKGAHFTANEKDIEKLTNGKDSSKKGNNSDIVVEHGHKDKGGGFHGVSLKSGGSSKLFNPGMGGITKVVDEAHEKATGKKGNLSKSVSNVDNESQNAHHAALVPHAKMLASHFGEGHVRHDPETGTVHLSDHALNTMRYAHERMNSKTPEKTRVEELKGVSNDKVKKLANAYGDVQKAKLQSYKHPVSKNLHAHLKAIFSATGGKAKKAQHGLISSLTNTPTREEEHMGVMRHNTEMKKGGRQSRITYGLGDSARKTHSYEVNRRGISNEIIGRDKKGNKTLHLNVVADASPSSGSGSGTRKGLHVWDMMKEK
jgi:hypothetical protein